MTTRYIEPGSTPSETVLEQRTRTPIVKPTGTRLPARTSVLPAPPVSTCSCQNGGGSGLEGKIKENPFIFLIGAAVIGYFLAKT